MQQGELELQAALNAHRAGLLDEAARLYQGVLTENPLSVEAMVNLAVLHGSEGRLAESEALYRQVLELAPDDAQIHSNFGNLLQTMGRLR